MLPCLQPPPKPSNHPTTSTQQPHTTIPPPPSAPLSIHIHLRSCCLYSCGLALTSRQAAAPLQTLCCLCTLSCIHLWQSPLSSSSLHKAPVPPLHAWQAAIEKKTAWSQRGRASGLVEGGEAATRPQNREKTSSSLLRGLPVPGAALRAAASGAASSSHARSSCSYLSVLLLLAILAATPCVTAHV